MTVAFLGFTFLIAALFPVGGYLAQLTTGGLGGPAFSNVPPIVSHLVILVLTYAPAAVVTGIFFKSAGLKNRLPATPPGQGLMLTGVILTILYLAVRLFTSTIQGGGPSFIVGQFSPFILWPARILLAIGIVQVLLSAKPSNPSMHPTAEGGG